MKNTLFILCLLFIPFSLISQFHTSVDIVGSYDFGNENFVDLNRIKQEKGDRVGYRFGGNFNFRIFDKIHIKTGIRYVRQGHLNQEVIIPGSSIYREYVDEYYLEIPLLLRYEFSDKRLAFYTELGMSPHFFLGGKLIQERDSNYSSNDYYIYYLKDKRIRFAITLGVGLNYSVLKDIQIFVQPTFRYFYPVEFEPSKTVRTNNYGIEIGVRRALSFVKDRP